jgi:hypothetical protein
LVVFHVIPAKAGIQRFQSLSNDWTPVFTGVTPEIQFFHTFGEGRVGVMLFYQRLG